MAVITNISFLPLRTNGCANFNHHFSPGIRMTLCLGCIFLSSGIFFLTKITIPARIPDVFFFSVFSRGILHRNGVLEVVAGIPVFCHFHRNFSQEFLWDRNSCFYSGFLRIPPDFCSHQTLSGSGQPMKSPPTSSPTSKLIAQICDPEHSKALPVYVFYSVQYHVLLQ